MKYRNISNYFADALKKMGLEEIPEIAFETPKNADHGDLSTNIAMQLPKMLKKPPRAIAEEILQNIEADDEVIEKIDIAGPGFINIKFTPKYYSAELEAILNKAADYGRQDVGKGKKTIVEYVSVNPTGLLHLGHGRNAAIGDTVSNLYDWMGYDVTREYYFNNAGNQMNNLAKSIYARYMQIIDSPEFPFPEDGYHGDYIKTIAQDIVDIESDKYIAGSDDDIAALRKAGELWAFDKIKATLGRMNINQDNYFNEDSLYSDGKIENIINEFKNKGLAYEKDDALWLKLSEMGLQDDRVIVKSTGEPTYRLPDMAYHREKFERGFDVIVDLFGSDHIATIPDVLTGVKSLGYDTDKVKVLIHQFVTLMENGEQVKMSKRTGKNYTLDDLLDEVGEDVVRFFLIMRGINTHLEFDLDLAKEQSDKNPVFYLQYAHARLCSIFDNAIDKDINIDDKADLTLLVDKSEISLIKTLMKFPDYIRLSCDKGEPMILAEYLRDLAAAFHVFYHNCRIIGSEEKLMQARFKLAAATKITLKNGLDILGVSSPERM